MDLDKLIFENMNFIEARCKSFSVKGLDWDDLRQESILKAYTNASKFKEGTNFKAWISIIIRNVAINYFRKTNVDKRKGTVLASHFIESLDFCKEHPAAYELLEIKGVYSLLEKIDPFCRSIFLRSVMGYTSMEISLSLDMSEGTIKSIIFKVRKMVRKAKSES